MKKIYFLLLSLLLSVTAFPSETTEGTEFWVTFMANYRYTTGYSGLYLKLIISSPNNTEVLVENPQTGWKETLSIAANTIGEMLIPHEQGYTCNPTVENKGLRVTSTSPISLYASNYAEYSYDATIVVPITGLGDEYVIQTFDSDGGYDKEFVIVATEDNTTVEITPHADINNGYEKNEAFNITLQKGQTYLVMSNDAVDDLAGSRVKSNKMIAVFAGHTCALVPENNGACDHIVEQQLPTAMWGKNFALTKTYGQNGDYIRVTALNDNTNLVLNGSNLATINALETYTFRLTQNSSYLEASSPVACYLYVEGGESNNDMSDPSVVLISPIEQLLKNVTFATFETNMSRSHYVNVVTTTNGAKSIKLDNENITDKFSPLKGNDQLAFARIPISHGTHTLSTNKDGFIGHVYGLGVWESYAYSIGSSTLDLSGSIIIEGVISSDFDGSGRCYKKPITFSPQTNDDYNNIIWNFGDGSTSNQATVTHTYAAPGTYEISMIISNEDGRDTAYASFTLVDVLYDTISVVVCDGESFMVGNDSYTYSKSGSYDITIPSIDGCDSIVTVNLTVKPTHNISIYDTICDGRTYIWDGDVYNTTGVYTKNYTNAYGCDSIVTLYLTISAPYNHEFSALICSGETYTWDGRKYNNTGVYTFRYSSVEGCDSVVTLYLTVGETYDIEFADTICQGETYVWNKIKYTKAGSYSQSFTTQHGCDSNVTVHLFVAPIVYESYAEAICQDQPYQFGKRILTLPGVYVDTAVSMYGCDSITTLTLRIHEPYLIDQYIEVCHDDTFNFRGKIVSKPGIYYDSLLTQHGCDSVYRLIYNKTPTYLFHSEDTMCVGATYTYRGKKITKAGIYYDSLTTVSGCDSIYRLVLHTHPTYMIYSLETEDICADAPTYEMVVQYDGVLRPSHYNLIYSKEAKSQGFRDVVQAPFVNDTLHLPIPHATPYIRPDYYNVTLQLTNPVCPAVTSEYETQLLVRYPSWIIEQNWQDVVATKNAQYNGGYYFQEYDWYVNNVSAAQANSYLYLPSLQVGDEVVLYATRMGEDYAIPTCPIIIEQQDTYEHEHPVPVYPVRISRADRSITLFAADSNTRYHVYDILGRSLASGMCEQGDDTIVDMPTMSGSYFVMLVDAEENKQVVHFMVE